MKFTSMWEHLRFFRLFKYNLLRRKMKSWHCLFTYFMTPSPHNEIAHSLVTECCLAAFTRLLRGKPKAIVSDNGLNFVGSSRELTEKMQSGNPEKIGTTLAKKNWTRNSTLSQPPFKMETGWNGASRRHCLEFWKARHWLTRFWQLRFVFVNGC